MEKIEEFKLNVKRAAEEFLKIDNKETIRLISHLDSDGISAVSIIIKALIRKGMKYSLTIVPTLDKKYIQELEAEEYTTYVFCDLGSGQVKYISEVLKNKKIFILDHHEIKNDVVADNIIHVNPHLSGIDGGKDISGAGVMFFFAQSLDKRNSDLSYLAIIGAIGDVQENKGFIGINQEILDIAQEQGKIEVKKGLRFFGIKTRPIHKLLEYSFDPFIPGVSGSETGAIMFLQELDINPKKGSAWKLYDDLNVDERNRLITGIILKRESEEAPEDIFGFQYDIKGEEFNTLKDAKEFSTLLNACGRLNKAALGIGACIGSNAMKKKAITNLNDYKKEIVDAINWYNENKKKKSVVKKKGYLIINAQDNIRHTIIGTLASILSKSNDIEEGTYILSMAQTMENKVKVSLRIAGVRTDESIDLRNVLAEIIDEVGGETGGHMQAAGAIMELEKEDKFVEVATRVLEEKAKQDRSYDIDNNIDDSRAEEIEEVMR